MCANGGEQTKCQVCGKEGPVELVDRELIAGGMFFKCRGGCAPGHAPNRMVCEDGPDGRCHINHDAPLDHIDHIRVTLQTLAQKTEPFQEPGVAARLAAPPSYVFGGKPTDTAILAQALLEILDRLER